MSCPRTRNQRSLLILYFSADATYCLNTGIMLYLIIKKMFIDLVYSMPHVELLHYY